MKKPKVVLTPEQRSEVKSLMEDSGYSRKEAVAWVVAFPDARAEKTRTSEDTKG